MLHKIRMIIFHVNKLTVSIFISIILKKTNVTNCMSLWLIAWKSNYHLKWLPAWILTLSLYTISSSLIWKTQMTIKIPQPSLFKFSDWLIFFLRQFGHLLGSWERASKRLTWPWNKEEKYQYFRWVHTCRWTHVPYKSIVHFCSEFFKT